MLDLPNGSISDINAELIYVCFIPGSRHQAFCTTGPLCARSGSNGASTARQRPAFREM